MEVNSNDEEAERAAISRTIAEEFALPETVFTDSVYLAADWPGEVQEGAVILVQTGKALPAGDTEEVAQSWMQINDRLEEQGVDLYAEVKNKDVTAFYRFS